MFAESLKAPTGNFDITKYLSLTAGSTRSSAQGKPKRITMPNKKVRYSYFNRLPFLWNALPPIDLSLLVSQGKTSFCGHTLSKFRPNNPCR